MKKIHTYKPLVGILTSAKMQNRVDGNKRFFQSIQRTLLDQKGASFLFTPSSLKKTNIDGFFYLPKKSKWVKLTCPYPDIIYNRIPYREEEETIAVQQAIKILQKEKEIPFFNVHFFQKDDVYHLFEQDTQLLAHLPKTILGNNKELFLHFLSTYQSIYAKPTRNAKGNGIFLLSYVSEEKVSYQSISSPSQLIDINEAWELLQKDSYILQEAIACNTINNQRYDLRVLVHFLKGSFVVSGVGIRLGKENAITTHVPHGGEVIPRSIVPIDKETIQFLATRCGSLLQQAYGAIYEFSLDIGMKGNHYYLFEVNAKPMSFDEPDIQETSLKHLTQVFQEQGCNE